MLAILFWVILTASVFAIYKGFMYLKSIEVDRDQKPKNER